MCGIIGCAGRITFKEEKAFKDLLYIDALRGQHSVGIGAVDQAGLSYVRKRAMPVLDFLDATQVQELFRKQLRCLIGHNRFATVGKVTNYNAHPFEMEHVMGVHNGSLKNMSLLQDHKAFDVDSEAIYHNINELGVAETAQRLDGAWALVWWDKRDHTLHMWRNEERPLFYVYSEDRKLIFWASEPKMLDLALSRHGIKYTELYEVAAHKEYKFVIPLLADEPISDIKIMPVQAYVRPVYQGYQGVNNFAKKTLALVTKTVGSTTTVLNVGDKVKFYIDRVNGKSADGYLINTPHNIDTTDLVIHGITQGQKRLFNENIHEVWEGVLNGRARLNGQPYHYLVQGNSIRLSQFTIGSVNQERKNAIITPLGDDVPEDTVAIEGEHITRREFMQNYGHCTCDTCGMDLEFESGIHVQRSSIRPTAYTCASCVEEQSSAIHGYNQRQH